MKKTPDEKAGPRIPFRGYWEILSTYLRRRRVSFVLLAFLICGGIGLQLVNPQILRRVIDGALAGSVGTGLILAAVLFIVVAMVQQACGVLAAYVGENLAWRATNELRADLAAHCLSLDMKYHNDTTPGELIQRIDADVAEFSNFFSQLVVRILIPLGGPSPQGVRPDVLVELETVRILPPQEPVDPLAGRQSGPGVGVHPVSRPPTCGPGSGPAASAAFPAPA